MFTTYRVPPVRTNPQTAGVRPLTEWIRYIRRNLFAADKKNAARQGHAVQGC